MPNINIRCHRCVDVVPLTPVALLRSRRDATLDSSVLLWTLHVDFQKLLSMNVRALTYLPTYNSSCVPALVDHLLNSERVASARFTLSVKPSWFPVLEGSSVCINSRRKLQKWQSCWGNVTSCT